MNKDQKLPEAKELLQKYLNNTTTPKEEQQVLRWYYSFGKNDDLPIEGNEQQRILNLIKNNVLIATQKSKKRIDYSWLQIAAILAICSCVLLFSIHRKDSETTAYYELSTHAAQRKIITLSDGTRIWLNNASKLKYPAKFNFKTREVELEGEAFFEVTHNARRPFIIHSHNLKVQVLGTSFNVRSYAADDEMAVNVATGKVAVSNGPKITMLKKNEGVVYNKTTKNFIASNNTAMSYAWQKDVLYFRYETLEKICISLERWYGVKCTITNKKLKHKRYTLEQHHETLSNVMKVLSAGEFHYRITGKSVQIW